MTVQLNDVLSGKGSRAREEQHKAVIDSQIVIVPESTDVRVTRPWLYSREFSGRLRLTDPEGKILDELDFLPPGRGRQDVQDESEAVNFWARYTIPADLSAGKYTVVVTAADLLQKVSAQAQLNFKID